MTRIKYLLLLSVLVLTGCSEKESTESGHISGGNAYMVRMDDLDPQTHPFMKPDKTDFVQIRSMADEFGDVDLFVAWLKTRTNVTDITHSEKTLLTSNPPQQVVSFSLDNVRHRLLLTVNVDNTVTNIKIMAVADIKE